MAKKSPEKKDTTMSPVHTAHRLSWPQVMLILDLTMQPTRLGCACKVAGVLAKPNKSRPALLHATGQGEYALNLYGWQIKAHLVQTVHERLKYV